MIDGQIITFLVVILCAPGKCIQGHIPLPDLTLTQCFANDPRIPSDALERWQVYEANKPKYVPVIAWCEQEKRRHPYRRICSDLAAVHSPSDSLFDQVRHTAHVCVGRTILDGIRRDLAHEPIGTGHGTGLEDKNSLNHPPLAPRVSRPMSHRRSASRFRLVRWSGIGRQDTRRSIFAQSRQRHSLRPAQPSRLKIAALTARVKPTESMAQSAGSVGP
jgi:hypothetical protein